MPKVPRPPLDAASLRAQNAKRSAVRAGRQYLADARDAERRLRALAPAFREAEEKHRVVVAELVAEYDRLLARVEGSDDEGYSSDLYFDEDARTLVDCAGDIDFLVSEVQDLCNPRYEDPSWRAFVLPDDDEIRDAVVRLGEILCDYEAVESRYQSLLPGYRQAFEQFEAALDAFNRVGGATIARK